MKATILILYIYIFLNFLTFGADIDGQKIIAIKGTKEFSFVLNEKLLDNSKWDGVSEPPLKISDVLKLSNRDISEIYDINKKYIVESIELKKFLGSEDKWYYLVSYNFPYDEGSRGPRLPLKMVVLMDSSVLKPTTIKEMSQHR